MSPPWFLMQCGKGPQKTCSKKNFFSCLVFTPVCSKLNQALGVIFAAFLLMEWGNCFRAVQPVLPD